MPTVTIGEAQAKLSDLIHGLQPDEELVITENNKPVARLILTNRPAQRKRRQSGTLRGTVLYMAPDFDAPLEDFKEYME
jgi:antitoxin (DNA-binding transcriptional repressor) of toxin-antitoxin stability system